MSKIIIQELTIIRGNTGIGSSPGISGNKVGILFKIQRPTDQSLVDISARRFTFRTADGQLNKDTDDGTITITDNIVYVPITLEDSLLYDAGHVEEYQIEEVFDGYERTLIKGRLLTKEGGSF